MPRTRSTTTSRRSIPYKPRKQAKATPQTSVPTPTLPLPILPTPTLPLPIRPTPDLFVWGTSDFGQLGLAGYDVGELPKPKKHPWVVQQIANGSLGEEPGAGIVSIVSGGLHLYLLDERGSVWSSGVNDEGALGRKARKPHDESSRDPSIKLESEFGVIQSLIDEGFRTVRLAAGDSLGAALNEHGELRTWGTFRDDAGDKTFAPGIEIQPFPVSPFKPGQKDVPDKIASICAGENHFLALSTQGGVYAWGTSTYGQLGKRIISRYIMDALSPLRVSLGFRQHKVVVIGTGSKSSFAVDEAGNVWAWGSNGRGQLGIGDSLVGKIVFQPTKILALNPTRLNPNSSEPERVIQIEGGEFHTVFLTSAGRVYACGDTVDSQLGLPADHAVFSENTDSDLTVVDGCLGTPVLVPIPSSDIDPIVSISCGPRFTMAVSKDGVLFVWGAGAQGELGLGEDVDVAETPTVVVKKAGSRFVTSVSCGGQHVAGLFKLRER